MKKVFLTLVILTTFIAVGFSQSLTPLKGVWKLSHSKNVHGEIGEVPPIFYKVFDSDNSFSNLSLREDGLRSAHKGKYTLNLDKNTYIEDINKTNDENTQATKAVNSLKITFSEDKTSFTIEGIIKSAGGDFPLYEVWKKLD